MGEPSGTALPAALRFLVARFAVAVEEKSRRAENRFSID
jgi:hypothetical protein